MYEGAPIDELAEVVIKSGDLNCCYLFAHDVENAPVDKLARVVCKSSDKELKSMFAKDIYGMSDREFADLMEEKIIEESESEI